MEHGGDGRHHKHGHSHRRHGEHRGLTTQRLGWRYWQLTKLGRLRSVTQKWIEWPLDEPLVARCFEVRHPAPADDCNCGIYASPDFETLREHGLCLVPDAPIVVGQVALGGRIIDDGVSLRAGSAVAARLSVVIDTAPPAAVDGLVAGLSAYRVPVDTVTLEEAVAGASATMLRHQQMSLATSRRWVPPEDPPVVTDPPSQPNS